MPKSKQKNQSKGKSDSKMAARSTPPKHTVTPPARDTGTPGVNRRLARGGAAENASATRGRAASQARRGGNRRGSQSR